MSIPAWKKPGNRESKEKKQVRRKERPDKEVVRELVPKRFQRQKKVFGKAKSEKIPVQKAWNHAIELKEKFMPKKGKVYALNYQSHHKYPQSILQPKKIESNKQYRTIGI